MRTPPLIANLLALTLAGTLSATCTPAFSVEPLRGPEIGQAWWTGSSNYGGNIQSTTNERFANFDVPLPTAVMNSMPFATIRYRELDSSAAPRYQADQMVGLGLMHHSAEGDPAWRLDVARGGTWSTSPSLWTRAIFNIAKPFGWIKPRPSDTVFSWFGINTIHKHATKTLIIPELAWTREGADGLAVDLVAPKHLLIGLRNSRFAVMAGVEQSLISYSTSSGVEQTGGWRLRRLTRIQCLAALSDEFLATVSGLKPWGAGSDSKAFGAEVSLQWNPNP